MGEYTITDLLVQITFTMEAFDDYVGYLLRGPTSAVFGHPGNIGEGFSPKADLVNQTVSAGRMIRCMMECISAADCMSAAYFSKSKQ